MLQLVRYLPEDSHVRALESAAENVREEIETPTRRMSTPAEIAKFASSTGGAIRKVG